MTEKQRLGMTSSSCFYVLMCIGLLCLSHSVCEGQRPVFTSQNGGIYADGNRFFLKGTSWFGPETGLFTFHGLWTVDYKWMLNFLANNGFNAIRVPFSTTMVTTNPVPTSMTFSCATASPASSCNADLRGLRALDVLDKVIAYAGTKGMVIMLDLHSFLPDNFGSEGRWYDAAHSESSILAVWDILIARYKNTWNVIAADLKNEPFDTTWGGAAATDWQAAATRIGNYILAKVPWLIFVEGTADSPSCAQGCFYGEDLQGVRTSPIVLNVPNKLVYSPHVYGPQVYAQSYFSASNFPSNMAAIWETHWGFIRSLNGPAVVLGEWGGQTTGANGVWLNALVAYLKSRQMTDQFFWCVNPNSGDTGGILQADWLTPDNGKLALLAQLVPNPTFLIPGAPPKPSSSTAAPPKPSSSTAAPPKPSSSTAAPPKPSSSTAAPSKPSSSTAAPSKPSSSTAAPSKPSSSTEAPSKPSSSTAAPSKPSSSTAAPSKPSSSTAAPSKPSSSSSTGTGHIISSSSTGTSAPSQVACSLQRPSFNSSNGHLYMNGRRFNLKGISWFGFDTSANVTHGLSKVDYKFLLSVLATNKFNALRIPLSLDVVLNNPWPANISYGTCVDYPQCNLDLVGLRSLEVLDRIISHAGNLGLLVMLDMHSLSANSGANDNLWYSAESSEARLLSGWDVLTERYKQTWNVFAADLKNEPHEATWGTGNRATDWDAAAVRIGNRILSRAPSWLIFVQGTGNNPASTQPGGWGENLRGVNSNPIVLSLPNRLVYSPHVFGPASNEQDYMSDANFPYNMPAIWDDHFGFVRSGKGGTIVVGEWGGPATGTNGLWMLAFVSYLRSKDMTDQFYWSLNPDPSTGGGLMASDWLTADSVTLMTLSELVPAPSDVLAMCRPISESSAAAPSMLYTSSSLLVVLLAALGVVVSSNFRL